MKIKELKGNVLGIGLDEKLINSIKKNNDVTEFNLISNVSKGKFSIFTKKFNIKKLRKKIKNKTDYIICNFEIINKYFNTFVSDSIYINKHKIFFYNVDNIDLIHRYNRYNCIITENKDYIEINNENCKTNFFKDRYYRMKDFMVYIIEIIGDILMG